MTIEDKIAKCEDLDELCDLLNSVNDEYDGSDLPTFGGPEPADTTDIYSWDAQDFLVPESEQGGWAVVSRQDPDWIDRN